MKKNKTTALIIEDNEHSMYMFTYLLESHNYKVFQSTNGIDGLTKADKIKPSLILLDIHLPLMNGYEVLNELRKNNRLRDVPIIAVTSYAMSGDREKILKAGASGYIEKPINPETFISQIESFAAIIQGEFFGKDNSCRR